MLAFQQPLHLDIKVTLFGNSEQSRRKITTAGIAAITEATPHLQISHKLEPVQYLVSVPYLTGLSQLLLPAWNLHTVSF